MEEESTVRRRRAASSDRRGLSPAIHPIRTHHAPLRELNVHVSSRDHEMQNDIREGPVSIGNPNVESKWTIPNVQFGSDVQT